MKHMLKKWIFIAKFHFQDPDPPGSGSATLEKEYGYVR